MSPYAPYILIWFHFFADFLFQTDSMALNKSKRWDWLLLHVSVYTLMFVPFGLKFMAVTFAAHLVTDAVSSRITSRLVHLPSKHWFFVVIGADQALHMTQLLLTYDWYC